jgi:hypothetical protein
MLKSLESWKECSSMSDKLKAVFATPEPAPDPKFKVGDRVKIREDAEFNPGSTGHVVTRVLDSFPHYGYLINEESCMFENELEPELEPEDGPDYNDGQWHLWGGQAKKPPTVDDQALVEYVFHDEQTGQAGVLQLMAGFNPSTGESPAWEDVLKFRVVKERQTPREFWVQPHPFEGYRVSTPEHPESFLVREVVG